MLRKIKVADMRRKKRSAESLYEKTPDWPEVRDLMLKGRIKPGAGEEIVLTEEEKAEYGISRRVVYLFLKRFIEENELPYEVKTYISPEGFDCVAVFLPLPSAPKAKARKTAKKRLEQ